MDERLRRRIDRMRSRSRSVRYEELEALWTYAGGSVRLGKGSHRVFVLGAARVSVPHRRPVLRRVYVEAVLDILEEVLE